MKHSKFHIFITAAVIVTSQLVWAQNVKEAFIKNSVVPDVVSIAPDSLASVCFPSGVQASLGNVLTPTLVKGKPTVSWSADPDSWYTLIMPDPDVDSRTNPTFRSFIHWLVVNIPGSDVSAGENIVEFVSSGPPLCTGLHRYVFLVYKQPGKELFDEPRISNRNISRGSFSANDFAIRHNLSTPIAGNFYQAQYDDYVPTVHAPLTETHNVAGQLIIRRIPFFGP